MTSNTSQRAVPGGAVAGATYEYDSDVVNLHELLGAAMDTLQELDYGRGPTRNRTLDRAAALVRIARDMTERMLEQRGVG